MILAEVVSQQANSMPFFILVGLSILIPLYIWLWIRKDYKRVLVNRSFRQEWQKISKRYDKRFEKDVEKGEAIVIKGSLSSSKQVVLTVFFHLFRFIVVIALYFKLVFMLNEMWIFLVPVFYLVTELLKSGKVVKKLYDFNRKDIDYYPPISISKRQPYFDFKSELITADKIKEWKNEAKFWLPLKLLMSMGLIYFIVEKY